jgi:hypothetical protein
MIGPTDLFQPSPAPHFKTFHVFLIYCPKRPNVNTWTFHFFKQNTEEEVYYSSADHLIPGLIFCE